MKAYHCTSKGQKYSAFILDAHGQFQTTVEEFKRAYGFNHIPRGDLNAYLKGLTYSRMSLSKDKTRLDLKCNPMTDDLAQVFSEWITRQPGFRAVSEEELVTGIPIEEFEFPY
jgi:hypothetical protein